MKKSGLIILICLAFSHLFASVIYPAAMVGQVLKVKKKVYMIRNKQRSDAKPQMPLLLKDAVGTEKNSRTKLFFMDNSILNLGELSKIEVEKYLYSPDKKKAKSIYRLIDGSLKTVVGRSDLEIHTRTAVVAARGTEFIIWIGDSDGSVYTGLIMLEGEATMRNIIKRVKGTVTVRKGQMSRVFLNEPPENVRPTDLIIMNEMTEEVGGIQTSSDGSDIKGNIINESNVNQSTNIAIGEDSKSNMGSIVIE